MPNDPDYFTRLDMELPRSGNPIAAVMLIAFGWIVGLIIGLVL